MRLAMILTLLPLPLLAATCPPAADHSVRLTEIYDELNRLPDGNGARALTAELWGLWTEAPDARAQALLDEGMRKRESYDFLGARDVLDTLVEYCPGYAEGYNQRAFASFLRRDFAAALHDLEKALEINPLHVAALSGKGLTLKGLGREAEAQEALRAAVALNPWLAERSLITEPPGEDI